MARGTGGVLSAEDSATLDRMLRDVCKTVDLMVLFDLSKSAVNLRRQKLRGEAKKRLSVKRPLVEERVPRRAVLPVTQSDWLSAPTREQLMGGR